MTRREEDFKARVKRKLPEWPITHMDSECPWRHSCNNVELHRNCWLDVCYHSTGLEHACLDKDREAGALFLLC
jgi:hypothetical protein